MNQPIISLEGSTIHGGLNIKRDGVPVTIEDALANGFTVSADDANVVLSMIVKFIQTRDENHG